MLKRVAGLAMLLLVITLAIVGIITACAPLIVEVANKEAEGRAGTDSTESVEQAAQESAAEVVKEDQSEEVGSVGLTTEEKLAGARPGASGSQT